MRLVGYFIHLAVAEIDDGHLFALAGVFFEEDVIRLKISVHDPFFFDMSIPMNDLPEDEDGLILREAFWMCFDVVGKSAALEEFHNNVKVIIEDDHFDQLDDILVLSFFNFAQVAKCGDLTAEEVPGDFVVDGGEIDAFDGKFGVLVVIEESQVDIASAALSQQFVFTDGISFVQLSDFRMHLEKLYYCNN